MRNIGRSLCKCAGDENFSEPNYTRVPFSKTARVWMNFGVTNSPTPLERLMIWRKSFGGALFDLWKDPDFDNSGNYT